MFGGSVEIEEFREGSVGTIILEEPPICTIIPEEHTILTKLKYKRVPSLPEQAKKKNVSWADEQEKVEKEDKILKKNNKSNYTLNNTKQHRGTKRRQKPNLSTTTQTQTQQQEQNQKKNKKRKGKPSQTHRGPNTAQRTSEEEDSGLLKSLGITIRR